MKTVKDLALGLCLTALVSLPIKLGAEPVKLTINFDNGTTRTSMLDSSIKELFLRDSAPDSSRVVGVSSLSVFPELESLTIFNATKLIDYSFIEEASHLRYLYLQGVTISDFHFLESLTALEKLHMDFWVPPERFKAVMQEPIDLSRLTNLRFILAWSTDHLGILPFAGASSRPFISLDNNKISKLSERDLTILRQFGAISIRANPVADRPEELKKIKGSRVFSNAEGLPEEFGQLYRDFE